MPKIKKITDSKGKVKYEFFLYGGINPQTGKKKKYHRVFETKKEATIGLSRLQLEINDNGMIKKDNNVLFSAVADEFYSEYITTVRESTYYKVKYFFDNHIIPEFGHKRIRTITVNDVQKAVNKWFKDSPSSYKRWNNFTGKVFELAIKRGYMTGKNPVKLITLPKVQETAGDDFENFWDKEELQKFFNCIDPVKDIEKFTAFRLLAFGGLRRAELLALTWGDINLNDKTVRINKNLAQGKKGRLLLQAPKTKKSRRTIILDDKTISILKSWKKSQRKQLLKLGINSMNKEQLLFPNRFNRHKVLNQPGKWLAKIIKDNDLTKITVHGFRHSHCSLLFSAGATIKEVQDRLGHERPDITLNIYTHVSEKQNIEAVEKLAKYASF
ncbi:tyrosine-type recombinase/integrase [Paucilactobacillus nenjiangensis]|jgi:integrase|uniref:tyrosine-type recombinase/integrase n=1 Tax=Paucilactobacillus nenjiangensis TaxID=1296540 RepID=UPI003BAE95B9